MDQGILETGLVLSSDIKSSQAGEAFWLVIKNEWELQKQVWAYEDQSQTATGRSQHIKSVRAVNNVHLRPQT